MPLLILVLPVAAALLTVALVRALMPLLQRYALARPNARSSHRVPTPQGGGIAVLGAALPLAAVVALFIGLPDPAALKELAVVTVAAIALAVLGAWDDVRPLSATVRLAVQTLAVAAVVLAGGPESRVLFELVPPWLEFVLLVVAGVWFVNLVNFTDGLDWMTVAEFVPALAFFAVLALVAGDVPPRFALAAALLGALMGFAVFNKPVARLFLGDVGALPIGLLVGWLTLKLASAGALAAAILLVLYPVADATITLCGRLARGEKVWQAHRTHFYQRATDNGFSVLEVSASVFCLNVVLAALAFATLVLPPLGQAAAVALGALLVAVLLWRFARSPAESPP
jgi:UDP-N-acetylmuramyl pentapeptide phosphotransferase/UDP-N-acetylglucosamine-1-phosphate transferase